jgi:SAM-dependent methyltransferase
VFKKYRIEYDLDDPRATMAHREIILRKPFLKKLYTDWYNEFLKSVKKVPSGKYLEIGSGGGFLKDIFPGVITSDILDLPNVDKVFSAEELPFGENELAAIMMLNVFHHIPRPDKFLKEVERTLMPGGRVIMIEPANSRLGRFIYKNLHHEDFDEKAGRTIRPGNPLTSSNQALPFIYFERDVHLFTSDFPQLKIVSVKYHTPFLYAFSGGVSRSALLPFFLYPVVKAVEWLLKPLSRQIGLFCTVEIEKTQISER